MKARVTGKKIFPKNENGRKKPEWEMKCYKKKKEKEREKKRKKENNNK